MRQWRHTMMDPAMFRVLGEGEIATFRQWARDNYIPGQPINQTWHPVVQLEAATMNVEVWREANANLLSEKRVDDLIDSLFER